MKRLREIDMKYLAREDHCARGLTYNLRKYVLNFVAILHQL
jgi:hypothetical protein